MSDVRLKLDASWTHVLQRRKKDGQRARLAQCPGLEVALLLVVVRLACEGRSAECRAQGPNDAARRRPAGRPARRAAAPRGCRVLTHLVVQAF